MIVIPFSLHHLDGFELQDRQEFMTTLIADKEYREGLAETEAYSVLCDGVCVMMAGLYNAGGGRALVWCMLSKYATRQMFGLSKTIRTFLELSKYQRIEATIETNFKEGHRWAELLGMIKEVDMPNYYEGQTYSLYARCK